MNCIGTFPILSKRMGFLRRCQNLEEVIQFTPNSISDHHRLLVSQFSTLNKYPFQNNSTDWCDRIITCIVNNDGGIAEIKQRHPSWKRNSPLHYSSIVSDGTQYFCRRNFSVERISKWKDDDNNNYHKILIRLSHNWANNIRRKDDASNPNTPTTNDVDRNPNDTKSSLPRKDVTITTENNDDVWMAHWVEQLRSIPNIITLSRMLSSPLLAYWVVTEQPEKALLGCCVAALSDVADGYLARNYNMSTTLGTYLDPLGMYTDYY
jgi:CDP-alcohol phosphatidyltransferase